MSEFNPYAPPAAEVGEVARPAKKGKKKKLSGAIAEAIERLNEHLDDAGAVAFDRKEAGGKLRTVTILFVVFAVAFIGAAAYFATNIRRSNDEVAAIAIGVLAFVFALLAVVLVVADVQMPPRDEPRPPEETLKHFFKAISLGRFGYAWAALCPTAREQKVETPILGQIPVGSGPFALRRTEDLKQYTQAFARPGSGQMRTMQIKRAVLIREDGDVATVEVTALFQSWPQWAQFVSIMAFVFIRLLGAVLFLILFFALRKTYEITYRKTLIRGSNGAWYVYSGDLLEGAAQQDS
jgi:hypothetical protein